MHQPESSGATRPRRAFNTNYFTLYTRFTSTEKQQLKFAFGTRAGTATVRNRAKRLAREIFRLKCRQLPAGIEILITAKKGMYVLSRRDIRDQIGDLLERGCRLALSNSTEPVKTGDTSTHR